MAVPRVTDSVDVTVKLTDTTSDDDGDALCVAVTVIEAESSRDGDRLGERRENDADAEEVADASRVNVAIDGVCETEGLAVLLLDCDS